MEKANEEHKAKNKDINLHKKNSPIARYKGKMTKQKIEDVDKQIASLRNEWNR